MHRIWYYVVSKSGADREQWLDMFAKKGLDRSDDLAPVYSDIKPRKPHGGPITIEQVSDLREALRATGRGECLTIPHFGHLISAAIWEAVAGDISAKGAVLESIADEMVLDGADIEAGKRLLKSRGARTLTDARRRTRVKMGRPKKALTGKRLEEAIMLFPSPEWTSGSLATKFGLGRMTFLRRIEDATGTMSKERAQEESAADNWPPKRKLTR